MAEVKRTFESEVHTAQDLKFRARPPKEEAPGAEFGEHAHSRLEESGITRPASTLTREVVLRLIGWLKKG